METEVHLVTGCGDRTTVPATTRRRGKSRYWPIAMGNDCDIQPGHGPGSKHPMVWSYRVPIRRLLLKTGQRGLSNLPLGRSGGGDHSARGRDPESKQPRYECR